MRYRRLGSSGRRLSAISYGSWATIAETTGYDEALECLRAAWELDINFLDTAGAYASGNAERFIGRALHDLEWPRWNVVIATKLYWGPSRRRKHAGDPEPEVLAHGYRGVARSPETRFRRPPLLPSTGHRDTDRGDCVDDVGHRRLRAGPLLGTSEWPPPLITHAVAFAVDNRLRPPVVEQAQYNVIHRGRFESDCVELSARLGLGLVTWSPLASGLLSGKYLAATPSDARLSRSSYAWLRSALAEANADAFLGDFVKLATAYDVTPAQLAIAWCLSNPAVSSVILGARTRAQLVENAGALDFFETLADDGRALINEVRQLAATHRLRSHLNT